MGYVLTSVLFCLDDRAGSFMIAASCMGERTRFRNCHFQSSQCATDTLPQGPLPIILLPHVKPPTTGSGLFGKEDIRFLLRPLSTHTSEVLRAALPMIFFNPDGLVNVFTTLR